MSTGSVGTFADRWFRRVFAAEVEPDRTIVVSSSVVRLRMALIGVIAIAVQFAEIERRWVVTSLLLFAMLLQPVITVSTRTAEQTWRWMFAGDLAVSTAIALTAPSVVAKHLIVAVGLIGAAATCYRVRGFLVFTGVALCSITVVTIAGGTHQPEQTVVTAAVVGLALGGWMLRAQLVAESARRDREQAVDAAGGIFVTGRVGDTVLTCHGDVESLLGWTERSDGRINLRTAVHPEDLDDYWVPSDQLYDGAEIVRTARFRTKEGGWKWIRDVTRVVDLNGSLVLRGLLLDHTDQLDGLRKAKSEATTDPLTGLANRRVLVNLLRREQPSGRSLVLFDIDRFKRVNDTLGHEAGDELLRIVARRIGSRIRSADLLARLGGDEFALVVNDECELEEVRALVDRVLDAVSEPTHVHGVTLDVSLSAGIVREGDDAEAGANVLLGRADLAMYEAKRRGSGVEVFSSQMDERLGRRAELVQDLPDALARGDLRLFYQPVLDIEGHTIVSAEGLARWSHPRFGVLMPGEFLDVVLVSSQAAVFTRAMVAHGVETAGRLVSNGTPLTVAVNLPMNTLEDPAFARWFFERCAELDVDPSLIVFETSERELHSTERTLDAIDEFTARGVGISIDDFGTGHSTFERLRWSGVSQLKVDRQMVQGAARNRRDATILRNVVAMAGELGYVTVGEGVESEEQRLMLQHFGVDLVQGFLFAPALDLVDFLAFVERARPRPVLADRRVC